MKRILLLLLLFISCLHSPAQHKGILPHYAKLQFAGGTGFLSAGVGYQSKNKRLQYDVMYGYVPESLGGVEIHCLTGKFTWVAVTRRLKNNIQVDWLTTGLLINYVFGKQYFFLSPDNYPLKYYGLPTAAHVGIFTGGGIRHKRFGLYYEVGTTDRDLTAFIQNIKSVPLVDIINIGIGAKFDFKKI